MNKLEFIKLLDGKLKLIRTEYGLTQEKMASVWAFQRRHWWKSKKAEKVWVGPFRLPWQVFFRTVRYYAMQSEVMCLISSLPWHLRISRLTTLKPGEAKFGGKQSLRKNAIVFSKICFPGIIDY